MAAGTNGRDWRRGLLRLWVVLSAIWILLIGGREALTKHMMWKPFGSAPPVQVRISDTETWEYPTDMGEKRIRDNLAARLWAKFDETRERVMRMSAERRAFCDAIPKTVQIQDVPGDCAEYIWEPSRFGLTPAIPVGWETQLRRLPSAWSVFLGVLPLALGVPALVALVGLALFWVISGF